MNSSQKYLQMQPHILKSRWHKLKIFYTFLCLFLMICILSNSGVSLTYALMGLQLWFEKMIPALFPFMIISGIMIRMKLTGLLSGVLYPVVRAFFPVSPNGCYAMIIGFLCGFPMGAKTIADLFKRDMISRKEAEYLLAFCNNIGPVYFCSFVLPLLNRKLLIPYLLGMYAIPLFYGMVLGVTAYKKQDFISLQSPIVTTKYNLLNEIDDTITSSIQSILSLGGYMIVFNMLNLIPHIFLGNNAFYFAPFLEITGGLKLLNGHFPLYCLIMLCFGGLSCMAQTNHCIQGTGLSLLKYMGHKMILVIITLLYYLGWFLLFPTSFLR